MSNVSPEELTAQRMSSGSVPTLASRTLQPISDPSASKRVCFYKSGDHTFGGHRMVITARTFKTFDALLDALSKKVPLPFGVRIITTPRGTHQLKGLEDLHDGGLYVCSDRRRVKPLNLDEVNRQQIPWDTTRSDGLGRRGRNAPSFSQSGRRSEGTNRIGRINERPAVRTPKRFVVFKNKEPTIQRTIVLQRRTAPTFDALLDYLSQTMQFPVLKLYSADGRRVDGLAALILCSGIIVAAGSEPFRLGNYNFNRTGQMAQSVNSEAAEPINLQPLAQKNKSSSSGRASRHFSLSSERHIVNQINKSLNGSTDSHQHHHKRSSETEGNPCHTSNDMDNSENSGTENRCHTGIVPQDDDIEKSFRVNQDGSMTVEMKVRLTIKEEEMLHWTTTLSRYSLSQRTVRASKSRSGKSPPDTSHSMAKDNPGISEDETKQENHDTKIGKGVGFIDERERESFSPTAETPKSGLRRNPTPGPRHIRKKASVESVKTVTESGVEASTLGQYSYTERTADGELTEGYCVVRQSSSSSRPVPKPRKTTPAGVSNKGSHSSIRSSGTAEVLQIQNEGMEVTETVMHIYERQGCFDTYSANKEYSADGIFEHGSALVPQNKPASCDSGQHSSSNDCDVDFTRPSSITDSLHRQKEEILSLSSEPKAPTPKMSKNLSSLTDNEAQTVADSQNESPPKETESVKKTNVVQGVKKRKTAKPTGKQTSPSVTSSDKKQKESLARSSKSGRTSESDTNDHNSKGIEKNRTKKKLSRDESTPIKKQVGSRNVEILKAMSPKKQPNVSQRTPRDNGNMHESRTARLPTKKKSLTNKQKTMSEKRMLPPKQTLELSESVSTPAFNPTPSSDLHQYVENWLQKIKPEAVPYMEEAATEQSSSPKVVFQIGGDSESEDKSECQANIDEHNSSHGHGIPTSTSLSVPVCSVAPTASTDGLNNGQRALGICVSMPTVKIEPVDNENQPRTPKAAEGICPVDSSSNRLSLKSKVEPVLQQMCSSLQSIRSATERDELSRSSSLPNFSSQVASVFGSSSKVFLSYLSVMTLRGTLAGSEDTNSDSEEASEAMLMLESLQKISTIEDDEEQRASLTDLQSKTSFKFRERWRDFQVLRERLESEPLSPKFSEFALDVSEGGDPFEDQHLVIDQLMDELNMPQDLREEITSTLQHNRNVHPEVEKSTTLKRETHHSDSEEMEQFPKECDSEVHGKTEEMEVSDREEKAESEEGEGKEDEEKEEGLVHMEEKEENENYEQLDEEGEEKEIRDDNNGVKEIEDEAAGGAKRLDEVDMTRWWWRAKVSEEERMEEGKVATDKNTEDEGEGEEEGEDEDVEECRGGEAEVSAGEVGGGEQTEEAGEGEQDSSSAEGAEEERGAKDEQNEEEQHFRDAPNADADGTADSDISERPLEEACYLHTQGRRKYHENKNTNVDTEDTENEKEDDMGHGSDTMNEEKTDGGEGEVNEDESCNPPHPVEISQELLDFVNSALQSSSLTFTYDARGNVKIEQDNAQVVHTKPFITPKSRGDNLYGLKRLPSPNTSDLSDYRPETSDSGGYDKTQASLDISSESVENSESPSPNYTDARRMSHKPNRRTKVERTNSQGNIAESPTLKSGGSSNSNLSQGNISEKPTLKSGGSSDSKLSHGNISEKPTFKSGGSTNSKLSQGNISEKSGGSFSTYDSGTKALGEDLSNYSSASSLKAHMEPSKENALVSMEADSNSGVLIDQGRWLLKENHLIRRSPPISSESVGMYGNADTTSIDSCPENTGEVDDSAARHKPLDAISSSELENMAKPQTPKCAYYNMPHGSDSDPFLDDVSVKSRNRDTCASKTKGVRVSPTIDTSKTWPKKNSSLSSFTSVEFKMSADSRVHPEGESSAVTQAARPSSVAGRVLQAQDSREVIRSGRCPIL